MGALSNKGGREQRNREEIGAEATFSRGFAARSRALRARISLLRPSCAQLDKTAMLRRLAYENLPVLSNKTIIIITIIIMIILRRTIV